MAAADRLANGDKTGIPTYPSLQILQLETRLEPRPPLGQLALGVGHKDGRRIPEALISNVHVHALPRATHSGRIRPRWLRCSWPSAVRTSNWSATRGTKMALGGRGYMAVARRWGDSIPLDEQLALVNIKVTNRCAQGIHFWQFYAEITDAGVSVLGPRFIRKLCCGVQRLSTCSRLTLLDAHYIICPAGTQILSWNLLHAPQRTQFAKRLTSLVYFAHFSIAARQPISSELMTVEAQQYL